MKKPRSIALFLALCGFGCSAHRQVARVAAPAALPADLSAMQRQVKNAVDAGEGDYELRVLRDRLIAGPGDLAPRLALAAAYAKRGLPELALDHYRLAAQRFPESADAALLLAKALSAAGQGAEAAQAMETFLRSHPQTQASFYSWLGILKDDAGDWKGGERAHRQALTLADRDYLHNNLGYALLMQGRKEEAAGEFRAALGLNPASAIARDNLGIALAGNPREAIVNWQSLNEPAVAHSNLAAILMEQGKYPEARAELAISLTYDRANPAALTNLKLLSELDGKPAFIPAMAGGAFGRPSGWGRVKLAFGQFWNGTEPAGQPSKQTPAQTAKRFPE